MSKKVLILSGSPRKGGNSDILCDEFLRGAQDAGNEVEKIRVSAKKSRHVPDVTTAGATTASAPTGTTWLRYCRR